MISDSKQVAPDKPFFMYFVTGAMQELGIIPADAELSRHDPDVPE